MAPGSAVQRDEPPGRTWRKACRVAFIRRPPRNPSRTGPGRPPRRRRPRSRTGTTILTSLQPASSKWWCSGTIRKTRLPVVRNETIWITQVVVMMTKSPPIMIESTRRRRSPGRAATLAADGSSCRTRARQEATTPRELPLRQGGQGDVPGDVREDGRHDERDATHRGGAVLAQIAGEPDGSDRLSGLERGEDANRHRRAEQGDDERDRSRDDDRPHGPSSFQTSARRVDLSSPCR